MKKKMALTGLVLILGIGIGAWSWYHSPAYALRELDEGIRTKNLAKVYRRVDLSALHASAIDAFAAKGLAETKDTPGFLETMRANLNAGMDKVVRSQSLDLVKHEFELELMRDRKLPAPLPVGAGRNLLRLLFHDVEEIQFGDWVYDDRGALVNAGLKLRKMARTLPLTFRMLSSKTGIWRVSEFEGLSSLLSQYEKAREEAVEQHNRSFQERAEAELPFFGEVRVEDEGLSTNLSLDCLWQNKSPKVVERIRGEIQEDSATPRIRASFDSEAIHLAAGEKRVYLIKKEQFLSPARAGLQGVKLSFRFDEVIFAGGESWKRVQDFDEISP